MSNVHICDYCGKVIKREDVRIAINGYRVFQNENIRKLQQGYEIKQPEDFCSFNCVSLWAKNEQKILDEYIEIAEKHEKNEIDVKEDA